MADQVTLQATQGTRREWTLALFDESGNAITSYSASDTLTAEIWSGGEYPTLATLTASWVDASAGTLKLVIGSTDLDDLDPQPYPVRVRLDHAGETILVWQGWIDVSPAPGTATLPATYGSFADMLVYSGDWLKRLAMTASTCAGFAKERGRARSTLDDWILARYRMPYNGSRALTSYPTLNALPGPDPTIRAYLDANCLRVTDKVIEVVSRLAIAFACADQNDDEYRQRAAGQYRLAVNVAKGLIAELDINADGKTEIFVDLGTINTRVN